MSTKNTGWREDVSTIREGLEIDWSGGWRNDVRSIAESLGYSPNGWRDALRLIASGEITKPPEENEITSVWQPHPDWWDIETIIKTGIVPWQDESLENIRYGFVVSDSNHTITLVSGYEYYLSDGSYYDGSETISHAWDRTKDKECSDGYKTRCVIVCGEIRDVSIEHKPGDGIDSIYIYLGDCNIYLFSFTGSSTSPNNLLKSIRHGEKTTLDTSIYGNSTAHAFQYCYALKDISIPNGLTTIGAYAFQYCYALSNITLPSSLTGIGVSAFQYCYALKDISIPNGLTTIGAYAFQYCYALSNITLPSSLTGIGVSAFQNCYALSNITLPGSLTGIGVNAFSRCYALKNINMPDNLENIYNNAFNYCYSLIGITIKKDYNSYLYLQHSTSLSVSAVENIAHNYADRTGQTALTFTVAAAVIANMSEDTLAEFTNKNIAVVGV